MINYSPFASDDVLDAQRDSKNPNPRIHGLIHAPLNSSRLNAKGCTVDTSGQSYALLIDVRT